MPEEFVIHNHQPFLWPREIRSKTGGAPTRTEKEKENDFKRVTVRGPHMARYKTSSTSVERLPFDTTTMNQGIPARSLLGDYHTRHADWRKQRVVIP